MRLHSTLLVLIATAVVFTAGFFLGRQSLLPRSHDDSVNFSEVLTRAEAGQVRDVTISGTNLVGRFTSGESFHSTIPPNDPQIYTVFEGHGVNITVKDENSSFWLSTLISLIPFFLLATVPLVTLCLVVVLVLRSRRPNPAPQP